MEGVLLPVFREPTVIGNPRHCHFSCGGLCFDRGRMFRRDRESLALHIVARACFGGVTVHRMAARAGQPGRKDPLWIFIADIS